MDGNRDLDQVCSVFQMIENDAEFTKRFFGEGAKQDLLIATCFDIEISTTTVDFVVKSNFKKGVAGIVYVGDNFQKLFGKLFGSQVVRPRAGYKLQGHILTRNSRDWGILAEIDGGEETDLATVFHLISFQLDGRNGVLFTNGFVNIFYIRDVNNELRAVYVYWYGDGWRVDVYPVGHQYPWTRGSRVFSRNS